MRYSFIGKFVLGALLASTLAGTALAARVDARKLTCQQARSLVMQQGSVIMSFSATTYDRIVRSGLFCDPGFAPKPFYTKTADQPRCLVGNQCVDPSQLPFPEFWRRWR